MAEAAQAHHNHAYWVTTVLARQKASTAFKARWLAQGRRLTQLGRADIRKGAEAYLAEHPELFEQTAESVRNDPQSSKIVEIDYEVVDVGRLATGGHVRGVDFGLRWRFTPRKQSEPPPHKWL
jgi:hypothetical protein